MNSKPTPATYAILDFFYLIFFFLLSLLQYIVELDSTQKINAMHAAL